MVSTLWVERYFRCKVNIQLFINKSLVELALRRHKGQVRSLDSESVSNDLEITHQQGFHVNSGSFTNTFVKYESINYLSIESTFDFLSDFTYFSSELRIIMFLFS